MESSSFCSSSPEVALNNTLKHLGEERVRALGRRQDQLQSHQQGTLLASEAMATACVEWTFAETGQAWHTSQRGNVKFP